MRGRGIEKMSAPSSSSSSVRTTLRASIVGVGGLVIDVAAVGGGGAAVGARADTATVAAESNAAAASPAPAGRTLAVAFGGPRSRALAPDSYQPTWTQPPLSSRPQVTTYLERQQLQEAAERLSVVSNSTVVSVRTPSGRSVAAVSANYVKGAPPRMQPSKAFDATCDPRIAPLYTEKRTQYDMETMYEWSRSFSFFAGMTKSIHMECLSRAKLIQVAKRGSVVYLAGDEPTALYVVLQGSLAIYDEPDDRVGYHLNYARVEPASIVQRGERVGEKELTLDDTPVAATPPTPTNATAALSSQPPPRPANSREFTVVTHDSNVSLLEVSKADYLHLRTLNRENLIFDIISFLKRVSIFAHWSEVALGEIATMFQMRTFKANGNSANTAAAVAPAPAPTPPETETDPSATAAVGTTTAGVPAEIVRTLSPSLAASSAAAAAASHRGTVSSHSSQGLIVGENLDDIDASVLFALEGSALVIKRSEKNKWVSQRGLTAKQKLAKFKRKQLKKAIGERDERAAAETSPTHFRNMSIMIGQGHTGSIIGEANVHTSPSRRPSIIDAGNSPPSAGVHSRRPSAFIGHSRAGSIMGTLSPPGSAAGGRGHARRNSVSLFQQNETRKKALLEAMELRRLQQKEEAESSADEEDDSEEESGADDDEEDDVDEADAELSEEELAKKRAAASRDVDSLRETYVDAWVVARLKPNDMFGVSTLEQPTAYYTRNVFVRTAETFKALLISRKDFDHFVLRNARHADFAAQTRRVIEMIAHLRNGVLRNSMKRSQEEIQTMMAYFHVEIVRRHRMIVMPNEVAAHLYGQMGRRGSQTVVLSGSVSVFADSYDSDVQVLLCTLGRGEHFGELSALLHHRGMSLADVMAEVQRAVDKQKELDEESKKDKKKKKKKATPTAADIPATSATSSAAGDSTAMVIHLSANQSLVPAASLNTSPASPPTHRARPYGVTVVTNGSATLAKLEVSSALVLMGSAAGWHPTSLRVFAFLRGLNLFASLTFTRLLQLTYASRTIKFGVGEHLELQGDRVGPGGGGLWFIIRGEAECVREIGVVPLPPQASAGQPAVKRKTQQEPNQADAESAATTDGLHQAHVKSIILSRLNAGDFFGDHSLEVNINQAGQATAPSSLPPTLPRGSPHDPATAYATVSSTTKLEALFFSSHALRQLLPKPILRSVRAMAADRLQFRQDRVEYTLINSFPPSARVQELRQSTKQRSQLLRNMPMFGSNTAAKEESMTHADSTAGFSSSSRESSSAATTAGAGSILAADLLRTTPATLAAHLSKVLSPTGALNLHAMYRPKPPEQTIAEQARKSLAPFTPFTPPPLIGASSQASIEHSLRSSLSQLQPVSITHSSAGKSSEPSVAPPRIPPELLLPNYRALVARLDSLTPNSSGDRDSKSSNPAGLRDLLRGYLDLGFLDLLDTALVSPEPPDVEHVSLEPEEWRPRDKVPRSMFHLHMMQGDISAAFGPKKKWQFAITCVKQRVAAAKILKQVTPPNGQTTNNKSNTKPTSTTAAPSPSQDVPSTPSCASPRPVSVLSGKPPAVTTSPQFLADSQPNMDQATTSAANEDVKSRTNTVTSSETSPDAIPAPTPVPPEEPAAHTRTASPASPRVPFHSRTVVPSAMSHRAQGRAKARVRASLTLKAAHFRLTDREKTVIETLDLKAAAADAPYTPRRARGGSSSPVAKSRASSSRSGVATSNLPPRPITLGLGAQSGSRTAASSPMQGDAGQDAMVWTLSEGASPISPRMHLPRHMSITVPASDANGSHAGSPPSDMSTPDESPLVSSRLTHATTSDGIEEEEDGDDEKSAENSSSDSDDDSADGVFLTSLGVSARPGPLGRAASTDQRLIEMPKSVVPYSSPPVPPPDKPLVPLPWSTAPPSIGAVMRVAHRPTPTPGFIDPTAGSLTPSAVNIIADGPTGTAAAVQSLLLDVYDTRQHLVLPPNSPNCVPAAGTTPHSTTKPVDRHQRDAQMKAQGRLRDGRLRGPMQPEALYSRASQIANDILLSVPARLRTTELPRTHSSKEQQMLSSFMTQGKSVYKQADTRGESSPSSTASRLASPTAPFGPHSLTAPGFLASNPSAHVPTDDAEFHLRQQCILTSIGQKSATRNGVLPTPADLEKQVVEGVSAMHSFAKAWLGKAMPTNKDALSMPLHERLRDANKLAALMAEAPIEYRYEKVTAGSHPLSSAHVANASSTDAEDTEITSHIGSFTPVPNETQRANQRERRARSRSPAKELYALPPAATASSPVMTLPLSPPVGYHTGPSSMDVDVSDLHAREAAFRSAAHHPSDKFEESDSDYIPNVFTGVEDEVDGPTMAERARTLNKWLADKLGKADTDSDANALVSKSASHRSPKLAPSQPPATPRPPLVAPTSTKPLVTFGSNPAARHPAETNTVTSPATAVHIVMPSVPTVPAVVRAAAPPPKSVSEEKEEVWSAFRFHEDEDLPTPKSPTSTDPTPRFKTVELRPAVVTSHAFRIKALVGSLAVRLDLGVHFQHLFQRHFGFHVELERIFVSPLTGFVYVQYAPGRLPTRHIEEVVRSALVAEGHECCDIAAISMEVMNDETFRCLYSLTRAPPPGSGVAERLADEKAVTGVPTKRTDEPPQDAAARRAHSPTARRMRSSSPSPPRNVQSLLRASLPIFTGKSSLVDDLAHQLLAAPGSNLAGLNIDTPQLFPTRDPLNFHALAKSCESKSTWISPYVAAAQHSANKGAYALMGQMRGHMPITFMGASSGLAEPSYLYGRVSKKAAAADALLSSPAAAAEKKTPARQKSAPAMRLRKESPAAVLSHTPGLLGQYAEVAAAIETMTTPDAEKKRSMSPPRSPYGYATAASISSAGSTAEPGTPVMYVPLSARTPVRPSSQYTYRGSPRVDRRSESPQSAMSLTPDGAQSARARFYGGSSASAPASAPRSRARTPVLPAVDSSRTSSRASDSRPSSTRGMQPRPPLPTGQVARAATQTPVAVKSFAFT